jgi:hypothetical protein
MCRPVGGVFAALLLAAAGCTLDSYVVSFTGLVGSTRVMVGSVDDVSANLQAILGRVGVRAMATREGKEVHLAGVTKSGKKFVLVLKQQYAGGGQHTAVSIEWEDGADNSFWLNLLELMASPPPDGAPEAGHAGAPAGSPR